MFGASTAAQVRTAEESAFAALGEEPGGRPDGGRLMQRAAAGLAAVLRRELRQRRGGLYGARVLLLVGSGNNGGDALYAGARLARDGVAVTFCRTGEGAHPSGVAAARRAGAREVSSAGGQQLIAEGRADLVVDGILGIGGRPGLTGPAADLARACRDSDATVVAVDLPSGLDADRPALPDTAVRAAVTVTFGTRKPCHVSEPAASACGRIEVVDIGLDVEGAADLQCWEPADVLAAWPAPGPTSDKYSRGVVGVDTGSEHYPGAAVLGVTGALHAGAGMVRYLGPARPANMILQRMPSVVTARGRVQAMLLGSGWGGDDPTADADRVGGTIATGLPVVLDAGALGVLPSGPLGRRVLLTPHAGELARILRCERASVEADPVGAVCEAVRTTGASVLLKGATQYVFGPGDDAVQVAVPGPAWTGQAGSGDVLAGICAALLAAGLDAVRAGVLGASVQAMAAKSRPGPFPPDEIAATVAAVLEGISTRSAQARCYSIDE